jgi:hypothetical protein
MRYYFIALLLFITAAMAQDFTNVAPQLGVDVNSPWGDVFAVDFNGDDHNDLIYTSRYNAPGYYYQYEDGEYVLHNIGLPQSECDPYKIIPVDFDHDQDLDLFLCAYHDECSYYENQNGQLVNRTAAKGLSTRTGGRDIAVADLNHDGWMDIIAGYYDEGWRVYLNVEGQSFADITDESGLPGIYDFHRFCETDADLDGDVDLFMTTMHGDDYFFANNNGVFEDHTMLSGLSNAMGRGGCMWADFDNDKYPDILTGGNGRHTIWHNNGNLTFTEMTMHGTNVSFDVYANSAHYAAGDYDGDYDLDIYAGQPDGGWAGLKENQFFRCDSIVGLDAYFTDIAPELEMDILADTKPHFYDYDRDGDLDLFLRTYGEPSRLYRNDIAVAGSTTRIKVEGPEGEQDCWLTRVEVYEHGTETLVTCGETNYAGARRDGMCHSFTLDENQSYDLHVYFANGDVMTPYDYPDLADITPSVFLNNKIVIRRGVGVDSGTPVEIEPVPVPQDFTVTTYPNPFNPVTNIQLFVPATSDVTVQIYDVQGRLVTTLAQMQLAQGTHQMQWNAENFSTGVYILRVTAPSFTSSNKLMLIK